MKESESIKKECRELMQSFQNILDNHNVEYKVYRYNRMKIYDNNGKRFILKLMYFDPLMNALLCEIDNKVLCLEDFEQWLFDKELITELKQKRTYEDIKNKSVKISMNIYSDPMVPLTLNDFYISKMLTKEDLEYAINEGVKYREWAEMRSY